MGIFSKIFASGKGGEEETAAEPAAKDMFTSITLQLQGELERALQSYLRLGEEQPDDTLAPFFAASVMTAMGDVDGGAERLRDLSRLVAERGENISRAVAGALFTLLTEEPGIDVPALGETLVAFGDRLKQAGFARESAVCFEIAAGVMPEHSQVLHRLGDTLHDLGLYEYAEAVLKKSLEYAPNHWDSLYTYGVLLQDLGRLEEAIPCYERAVAINPDHVKCRNNFGAALMLSGRVEEAMEQCTRAAELDPAFPLAKVNLGNLQMLRKEYDTARSYFSEAISLDENLAPAYFGLGAVEQCCGGGVEKIRGLYARAVELSPNNPQFREALASLPAEGEAADTRLG